MSFGGTFGAVAPAAQAGAVNPNKDIEVTMPPADTVSSMHFSPTANHLVATSWDSQVRCWEVQQNGTTVPKSAISMDQPVLCSDWSPDGSTVFAGGCVTTVKMWHLQSNQQQQVAKHDAPVRHCKLIKDMNNMLVTASWDRTLRYWDLRQPTPVHTQQLPERVYAMDAVFPVLVVGLADAGRKIQVYNLSNPTTPFKELESPLKYQTRCITCFPDHAGFLVGSCEGRMAVQHVDDAHATKNFTFKCHRDGNDVYPVNSMAFHPQYGTFCSAGSDGTFNFWDKESKHRLKAMAKCSQPITAGCFSHDGAIYAYSTSYDWGKGHAEHNPSQAKTYIFLHGCQESEVKGRRATSRR